MYSYERCEIQINTTSVFILMTSPSHIQINTNVLKCIKAAVFMSTCKAPDIYIQIHSSIWNHVPPLIVKNLVENHAWGMCNVQFSTIHTSLNKFSSSMLVTFVLIEDEAWRNFEVFENKTKQNASCYQRALAHLKYSGCMSKSPSLIFRTTFLFFSFSLFFLLSFPLPTSLFLPSLGSAKPCKVYSPALSSFIPSFLPFCKTMQNANSS